jgi:hypothetical protein
MMFHRHVRTGQSAPIVLKKSYTTTFEPVQITIATDGSLKLLGIIRAHSTRNALPIPPADFFNTIHPQPTFVHISRVSQVEKALTHTPAFRELALDTAELPPHRESAETQSYRTPTTSRRLASCGVPRGTPDGHASPRYWPVLSQ